MSADFDPSPAAATWRLPERPARKGSGRPLPRTVDDFSSEELDPSGRRCALDLITLVVHRFGTMKNLVDHAFTVTPRPAWAVGGPHHIRQVARQFSKTVLGSSIAALPDWAEVEWIVTACTDPGHHDEALGWFRARWDESRSRRPADAVAPERSLALEAELAMLRQQVAQQSAQVKNLTAMANTLAAGLVSATRVADGRRADLRVADRARAAAERRISALTQAEEVLRARNAKLTHGLSMVITELVTTRHRATMRLVLDDMIERAATGFGPKDWARALPELLRRGKPKSVQHDDWLLAYIRTTLLLRHGRVLTDLDPSLAEAAQSIVHYLRLPDAPLLEQLVTGHEALSQHAHWILPRAPIGNAPDLIATVELLKGFTRPTNPAVDHPTNPHGAPDFTPGRFSPGSAMPLPDGHSPDPRFRVKASTRAMLYVDPDHPRYEQVVAEVWFDTVENAELAGYQRLSTSR
ncbi:sunset domain-containing protein [Actinokineospora diospyrosa]|uniref:DUF222 domain-containing protein n=1 Tax=Actinokineospora diospyrosa TaxID=103728 RepID=A0ABT1IDV3_9PSEU|nr:hypothetical protein [Actinokineospora diospyrosa]MCP2270541.1 hypothetical protein [Actinokineospora diospyrosa]